MGIQNQGIISQPRLKVKSRAFSSGLFLYAEAGKPRLGWGNIEKWCFDPAKRGQNTIIVLFSPPYSAGITPHTCGTSQRVWGRDCSDILKQRFERLFQHTEGFI